MHNILLLYASGNVAHKQQQVLDILTKLKVLKFRIDYKALYGKERLSRVTLVFQINTY